MKLPRVRIGTLMLLVVIAGLVAALVVERRRYQGLAAEAEIAKAQAEIAAIEADLIKAKAIIADTEKFIKETEEAGPRRY